MRVYTAGIIGFLALAIATSVFAAAKGHHSVSLLSGLFQQPASQYYHQYYGGSYEYSTGKAIDYLRISYVERPQFTEGGYSDQESSYSFLIGADAYKGKSTYIKAYFGMGVFQGYIKPANDRELVTSEEKRTYRLNGLHASMDAGVRNKRFFASIGHEMFVGYVNDEQLEAYVAWPVLFFNLRLGVLL